MYDLYTVIVHLVHLTHIMYTRHVQRVIFLRHCKSIHKLLENKLLASNQTCFITLYCRYNIQVQLMMDGLEA